MGIERIWAGWRNRYVEGLTGDATGASSVFTADDGSLFESILATTDDTEGLIVHRGRLVSVLLNAYPYSTAHVLVVPNRAASRLLELSSAESAELWCCVERAVEVIEEEYQPDGINVGLNQGKAAGAGVPDHLHVHVLPRWSGDTNFMTAVAETRVMPEPLDRTWDRLTKAWLSANRAD